METGRRFQAQTVKRKRNQFDKLKIMRKKKRKDVYVTGAEGASNTKLIVTDSTTVKIYLY